MNCKYRIIVEWSDVDKCYIAYIPQVLNLFAHARSINKAVKRLLKQYQEFVVDCAELPEPQKAVKAWT